MHERLDPARFPRGHDGCGSCGGGARRPASYHGNATALYLRAMNMLYEGLKEKGALMLVPSSAVESMGMGGLMGAAALRQQALTGTTAPAE